MTTAPAQSCASCGAPITMGDVAEGLAVRVDGTLICPLCVDTLPGSAQVKINQMRALRGLDVTTYAVPSGKHPDLNRFSFTTTTQLNQHRRALVSTGTFVAPRLPADHKPIPRMSSAEQNGSRRPPWIPIGIGVAAVITLGTVIGLAAGSGSRRTEVTTNDTTQVVLKQRVDYPAEPAAAWQAAAKDLRCPPEVLTAIGKEFESQLSVALDAARLDLASGRREAGLSALNAIEVPDDIRFAAFRARLKAAQSEAATVPPPPPPPVVADPEPIVAKAPDVEPVAPPQQDPPPMPPVAEVPKPEDPPAPTTATLPPKPADEPPPIATIPAAERGWLIPGSMLQERSGKKAFRNDPEHADARILTQETGSLSAQVLAGKGLTRCWVRFSAGSESNPVLSVRINDQQSELIRLRKNDPLDWYAIDVPDLVTTTDALHVMLVIEHGAGSVCHGIFLDKPDGPGPIAVQNAGTFRQVLSAKPVGEVPEAAAVPVPIAALSASAVTNKAGPWDQFAGTISSKDKLSDPQYSFPPNGGPFLESAKERNRHGVHFTLPAPIQAPAGVALVLHPLTVTRSEIKAIFTAADGSTAEVLIPTAETVWLTRTIEVPAGQAWTKLRLEDARDIGSHSFLVGKVTPVHGRPATVDDLALRPRAYIGTIYKDFHELVFLCGAKRKQRGAGWIQPSKIKILLAEKMTAGTWPTTVRSNLRTIFAKAWKGDVAPNGTISTITLHGTWLDGLYKEKDPKKAAVHPSNHHVLVIVTAGNELQVGMTADQALKNFWLPFLEQTIAQGIVPVPVLGPTRVDDDKREAANALWDALANECARARVPIPVIDLRPAQADSVDRMAAGGAQLAADLLGDGILEFAARAEHLAEMSK